MSELDFANLTRSSHQANEINNIINHKKDMRINVV